MILFISPSQRSSECAAAIETAVGQSTHAVNSFQDAAVALRAQEFSAVVIDECLLDADPDQGNLVVQRIERAVPIYVNCAISGIQRIVTTVHNAMQRRSRDEAAAYTSAIADLQCELREPLTGIILNCGLALDNGDLSPQVREKMQTIAALAQELSRKLHIEQAPACTGE